MFSLVFTSGSIIFFFLVGTVGNVVSCLVFYRQGLSVRINLCLFCLALVDLLTIAVFVVPHAERVYTRLAGQTSFLSAYFTGLTGFSWVSQFLSAVIASERCFCVLSPLKAQRMLSTTKMAAFILLTSSLLLGGLLALVGNKHKPVCFVDPVTNETFDGLSVSSYYLRNKKVIDILDVWLYSVTLPALFLLVVMVTTIITAAKLRAAVQWRQQTVITVTSVSTSKGLEEEDVSDFNDPSNEGNQAEKSSFSKDPSSTQKQGVPISKSSALKEAALTRMLIATSVLFMLCATPTLILQITTFLEPRLTNDGEWANLTQVLWGVVSVCRVFNSSFNFFVYVNMGSKFRETLKNACGCVSS